MVYVDNLVNYGWELGASCHMVGDTREELDSFAVSIGLKLQWADTKGDLYHFDLTKSKRDLAVKKGAIELSRKEFADFYWNNRTKKITP